MQVRSILVSSMLGALAVIAAGAQTPVVSSIAAPYPALQSSAGIRIAGNTYGSGAVNYGPAGAPLQLYGSGFGSEGTVTFQAYANGVATGSPVPATVTIWTQTMLFLTVPSGATTGLIFVKANGAISNGLPFIVTPGTYSGSCPNYRPQTQLEITTTSLPNGMVSKSYSTTLSTSGNSGTLTWALNGSTLPAGLSLNTSTGVISGTPTSPTSTPLSLAVTVTDSSSEQTADAILDISVDPQTLTSAVVYSYGASYDEVGNVTYYTDSVNDTWNFTYDSLNRLESMAPACGSSGNLGWCTVAQNVCFAYDAFGNRTTYNSQSSACPAHSASTWLYSGNQVSGVIPPGGAQSSASPSPLTYDQAGNVTADYTTGNQYYYDPEGRICAAASPSSSGMVYTGYLYDAEGRRIAKGTIATWGSCDPAVNGFQLTETYVLGPNGEESSTLSTQNGTTTWQRTNVYGAGWLLATYDSIPNPSSASSSMVPALHFHLTDPLGTRRVQTDPGGVPETTCQNLPYGDQLNCFSPIEAATTADDSTPLHFTGKERDTESGNDYFGARYYASSMGRFLSPDWSAKAEPVPYAKMDDPQSLNLYSYVRNNPLARTDPDGHCFWDVCAVETYVAVAALTAATVWAAHKASAYLSSSQGQADMRAAGQAISSVFHSSDNSGNKPAPAPAAATPTGEQPAQGSQSGPKPTPNFVEPTNAPQAPPTEVPDGQSVRVMPPTQQYPNGYWVQTNEHGQPINPSTGKPPGNVTRPEARAQTHVPLPPPPPPKPPTQ
jgi:RHS repeat-associated protein